MTTIIQEEFSIEKVDLFISAKDLRPHRTSSEGLDSFAVVWIRDSKPGALVRIDGGTTAVVMNNANPLWSAPITVDYMFQIEQEVLVQIYQWNADIKHLTLLKNHTLIGQYMTSLSTIVRAADSSLTVELHGKNDHSKAAAAVGKLTIRVEQRTTTNDTFCFRLCGKGLVNKDGIMGFFGKSDPFLIVKRMNPDNTYTPVWKSKYIKDSLNPDWGSIRISMARLCNGDVYRPLLIEIWDYDDDGKHDFMGQFKTSVDQLLQLPNGEEIPVIEPEQQKKKSSYKNSGVVIPSHVHIDSAPSFFDFIVGGLEMKMVIAVDFSLHNGAKTDPQSLHHITPTYAAFQSTATSSTATTSAAASSSIAATVSIAAAAIEGEGEEAMEVNATVAELCKASAELSDGFEDGVAEVDLNDYQKAIKAVSLVLSKYDSDKKFPVFALGTEAGPVIQINCSSGSSSGSNSGSSSSGSSSSNSGSSSSGSSSSEAAGVSGILQAYYDELQRAEQSSDCLLAPTIDQVRAMVEADGTSTKDPHYTVLCVFTRAHFADFEDVKRAVVEAAVHPMSVVIIGMGQPSTTTTTGATLASQQQQQQQLAESVSSKQMKILDGDKTSRLFYGRKYAARDIVQFVKYTGQPMSLLAREVLEEIPEEVLNYMERHGIHPRNRKKV